MASDPNRKSIHPCPRCGDPRGERTYSHDTPGIGPQYHNAEHTELVCAVQRIAMELREIKPLLQDVLMTRHR